MCYPCFKKWDLFVLARTVQNVKPCFTMLECVGFIFKAINVKRKHPFFPLTEREREELFIITACLCRWSSERATFQCPGSWRCVMQTPPQQSAAETAGPAFCWKPGKEAPLLTPAVSPHSFYKTQLFYSVIAQISSWFTWLYKPRSFISKT